MIVSVADICKRIPTLTDGLREVSDFIHDHPETGLNEVQAAEKLCGLLTHWGYTVRQGLIPELPTSFRAEEPLNGKRGPVFAFFAEYDALKGLGHGCGHNLIAASGLAAFRLASTVLKESGSNTAGKFVLLGTPAEEGYGGKVQLANAGAFQDLSAGIISHPYDITSMDDGALSVNRYHITFHGKASHAGMAPEKGINALDAMISLFQMIGLWRQQLPAAARVHGIITNGGTAANIIPAETSAIIYLRAPDRMNAEAMNARFMDMVRSAAQGTGCAFDIRNEGYPSMACVVNRPFNEVYADAMKELGDTVRYSDGTEGRGSTDFGDVSQRIPAVNVHFGICHKKGIALHTEEMREAAGSDYGFEQAMKCAAAMALIGIRYLTDEPFRNAVHQDFISGHSCRQ